MSGLPRQPSGLKGFILGPVLLDAPDLAVAKQVRPALDGFKRDSAVPRGCQRITATSASSRPNRPTIDYATGGTPFDDGGIARAVYEAAAEVGLSRPFLKLLPGENEGGLTMAEIGQQLKAYWEDDRPLTAAETRAVHRNIKKIEHTYKKRGQMPEDRVVVHQEWSHSEGVGRYYVSAADHEAIAAL